MDDEFSNFQGEIFRLYADKQYELALERIQNSYPLFPLHLYKLTTWKACFLSLLNRNNEAIEILEEGLQAGLWWSPNFLNIESDFNNIRDDPRFIDIYRQGEMIITNAMNEPPKIMVYRPSAPSNTEVSLFVALHYRGGNIDEFYPYLKSVTENGHVLAIPQSSQIYNMNEYCWDNEELAMTEISQIIYNLNDQINPSKIIICGASQGAYLALLLCVHLGSLISDCIIFMPPPKLEAINDMLINTPSIFSDMQFYIVVGDQDYSLKVTEKFSNMLFNKSIRHELKIIPDLDHSLPIDTDKYLGDALNFFNSPK